MVRLLILWGCVAASAHAQTGGVLRVQSDPPGAGVVVDGVAQRGVTTPADIAVAPGRHRVRVGLGGYDAFDDTVTVAAGTPAVVVARLVRQFGRLSVLLPPGATATVNGAPFLEAANVPSGLADIVVAVPGEPAMRRRVAVGPRAETEIAVEARRVRPVRVGLALLGPGLLQATDGRPVAGALYGSGVVGGIAAAVALTARVSRADRDARLALDRYGGATSEAAAVAAREEVARLVGVSRVAARARGGVLAAACVVYAVSLVDALARHVRRPALTVRQRPVTGVSVVVGDRRVGLAVRF